MTPLRELYDLYRYPNASKEERRLTLLASIPVDAPDEEDGCTVLHLAAEFADCDAIAALLDREAPAASGGSSRNGSRMWRNSGGTDAMPGNGSRNRERGSIHGTDNGEAGSATIKDRQRPLRRIHRVIDQDRWRP